MTRRPNPKREIDEKDLITLPTGHKVPRDEFMRMSSTLSKKENQKVIIDRLPAISGSIAGTSSRFLQEFRRMQQRERAREEQFERENDAAETLKAFEERREERQREFMEEAAKKRDKRLKRKLAKATSGELGLPSAIVRQIKEDERKEVMAAQHSAVSPRHPLKDTFVLPELPPSQDRLSANLPTSSKITIVEDED